MKKKSIKQWSTLCFAVILGLCLAVSAGWNYFSTNLVDLKQAKLETETCAEMILQLLSEWDFEELGKSDETDLYQKARAALRSVCQRYRQDYVYLYTIDPLTELRHYIICVASDDSSDEMVRNERSLGAISDDPLDEGEQAIMDGSTTLQKVALSNRYGREEVWLKPYLDDDGSLLAIIGMDYSVKREQSSIMRNFLFDITPVALILILGFIVQLILLRRRITDPILAISDSMRRFSLNSSEKPEPLGIKTQDEIGEIASSYEKMTEEISSYIANIKTLTQEKIENDVQLDIARRIQHGLVPEKTNLNVDEYSISALSSPAWAVGGDFYDCFMRDEKTVCIVMGDVSGKGIAAAIFMAMVKTMILEKLRAALSPAQALNEVNDELCAKNTEDLFATVFACTLDCETGRLTYANAGHTHPLLLGPEPSYLVPESGIVIGLFEGAGLNDFVLTLKPGEGILLYTDGITEAVNPEKQFFGEERLLNVISEGEKTIPGMDYSAEAVIHQVSNAVESFLEGCEPFDDSTILVLLRKGPRSGFLSLPVELSSFDEIKKAVFASLGNTPEARQVLLVCDELLANIVSYSGADYLEFACTKEDNNLNIFLSDNGVPFDHTEKETEEKDFDFLDSGGMGLSLVRQNVSSLTYERKNGRNELICCFTLEESERRLQTQSLHRSPQP